jgi:hypothetical protein
MLDRMIPAGRRGPLVVLAVVLLAPCYAVAQDSDYEDAALEQPDGAAEHDDHAPAGGFQDAPAEQPDPPDAMAPQVVTPNPNFAPTAPNPNVAPMAPTPPVAPTAPTPAAAPPQPAPNGPRERAAPAPTPPATVPMAAGSPPQPPNGSTKVLGRQFPSPVQPPPPAERPEVHVTIVPGSEPRVGKNRLRGDAGSPAGGATPGGSDQPAAGVTPDSNAD